MQGMISAVDNGFMSTSKNMRTPVSYMQVRNDPTSRLKGSAP